MRYSVTSIMTSSIDRRLFLTSLASAGLTACSGVAVPRGSSPLPAAGSRSPAVQKTQIYSGVSSGLSVDSATGNVYAVVSQAVMRFSPDGTVTTFAAKNLFLRSVAFDSTTGGFYACGLYAVYHFMPDGAIKGLPIPSPLWRRFDPACVAWDATRGTLFISNSYYPDKNEVYACNRDFSSYKSIAKLQKPHGMAVDSTTGMVFVAEDSLSIATISLDGTLGRFGSGLLGPTSVVRLGTDLIVADYFGVRRINSSRPVATIDPDITVLGLARNDSTGAIYISSNPGLYQIYF